MIEQYFFDTDCLSAFLWVHSENILQKLYPGRIILPAQVYQELSRVPHLLARIDTMKNKKAIFVESMVIGTNEYKDYVQMIASPETGMKIIGKGEAAGIAMAKWRDGILASNNMKDIRQYVDKYKIKYITTGDILINAMKNGIITEAEGNTLWAAMKQKRRMLPTVTFSDYILRFSR